MIYPYLEEDILHPSTKIQTLFRCNSTATHVFFLSFLTLFCLILLFFVIFIFYFYFLIIFSEIISYFSSSFSSHVVLFLFTIFSLFPPLSSLSPPLVNVSLNVSFGIVFSLSLSSLPSSINRGKTERKSSCF